MVCETNQWSATLSAYVDGELDDSMRSRVERHLLVCASCRTLVADFETLVREAPRYSGVPDEGSGWPALRERLVNGGGLRRSPRIGTGLSRRYWLGLAAAACLGAVVTGGAVWWLVDSRGAGATDSPPLTFGVEVTQVQDYERAIDDLSRMMLADDTPLAPETVAVIRENLAIIDRALADSRLALERDPANTNLVRRVEAHQQRKLTVLRQVLRASRTEL